MNDGVARFFAVCSLSVVCALASAYFIGTNKYEKDMILDKVHAAAHKFHKK